MTIEVEAAIDKFDEIIAAIENCTWREVILCRGGEQLVRLTKIENGAPVTTGA